MTYPEAVLHALRVARRRARDRRLDAVHALAFRLRPGRARTLARRFDASRSQRERLALVQEGMPGGAHQLAAEIVPFLEMVAGHRPRRILEIGTGDGGTTVLLSRVSDSVQWLGGVDLLVKNRVRIERLAPSGQQVVLIDAASTAPKAHERVRRSLGGARLDLLFIDGDHSYEGVRADFERYRGLVRPGGLIAFHDICEDYLTRHGRFTGAYAGGVPTLWREIRAAAGETLEFVEDREQDGCGIGVLVAGARA